MQPAAAVTNKPGRGTARGDRSRELILAEATRQFAADGFRGASLARIAEAVGRTQQGILHHFPSKKALLLAVIEQRDEEATAIMTADPPRALLARLGGIVAGNVQTPEIVRLFTVVVAEGLSDEHPAHPHVRSRYRRLRREWADAVRHDQGAALIRSDLDADLVANLLIAAMDGLQVQWLLDRSVDMTAAFGALRSILENGCEGPPTAANSIGE